MKLLSLHIDAFGKLRDFKIDFENGITEILGENGYGKTTLAVFIKSMLYGMPDNRDKGKIRKKYAPWSGGDFGGTLDIETKKGRYRIVRRFTPKTGDTFELLSLDTLLPTDDYGENIGSELFGIDAESYEKCTYLPQYEVDIKMTDSIGARLSALLEGSAESDMLDFSEAIESIKARRRELELYKGSGGLIEDEKNELAECEKSIAALEGKLREAAKAKNDAAALENEAKVIEQDIELLEKKLAEENENRLARNDFEMYLRFLRECEECKADLNRTEAQFFCGIPEKEELDIADELAREISFARKKRAESVLCGDEAEYQTLKEAFGDEAPNTYELTQRGIDARELQKKREELLTFTAEALKCKESVPEAKPSRQKMFFGCGVVSGVVGILLMVVGVFGVFALCAVGALMIAVGIGAFALSAAEKRKANELAAKLSAIRAESDEKQRAVLQKKNEISSLEAELDAFLKKYKTETQGGEYSTALGRLAENAARYESLRSDVKKRDRDIEVLDAQIEKKEKALADFLQKYGFWGDNEKAPNEIAELKSTLERQKNELLEKTKRAESFKKEKNIQGEPKKSELDADQLKGAVEAARRKQREYGEQGSRLWERAERLEIEAEALPTLKDRKETLKQLIEENSERRDIYDKTEKLISKAKENLSSRYIVNMKNSFAERFAAITDNEREISLDSKLEIKLRDEGGAKKASEYSTGWQAVIAVCLRLSLIDSLYSDERPFVILDDPFVNLDRDKLARALFVLCELSRDTQIVYLTCHESRSVKNLI